MEKYNIRLQGQGDVDRSGPKPEQGDAQGVLVSSLLVSG